VAGYPYGEISIAVDTRSLLTRLDEIGQSLSRREHALALIGLGSVGLELERLDQYSDLDFFVIVKEGCKKWFLDSLQWLGDVHPIAYSFLNTEDGYKLLFADGIFCEFAIFEPDELRKIPFAPGRIVWKREGISFSIGEPVAKLAPPVRRDREWLLGEALTNLYVGLQRDRRGETLTAMRFIQGYAVDRVLELVEFIEKGREVHRDPFVNERRFEQRHPGMAPYLQQWLQGYERNRESAGAILGFLEDHFEVSPVLANEIRLLSHTGR
jgi:lincosamide nucleotidyltransferase B/F